MKGSSLAAALAAGLAACAPTRSSSAPVLVLAAADLREALPEIVAAYRRAGGDSVTLAFGATGDLAAQITAGAPADVFFSADEQAIARLAAQGAVVDSTRRVYAVGRLALVGASGTPQPLQLTDLTRASVRTIVLANPAHAPYGRAAQQALQHAALWDALEPKLVYAPNVAQAYRVVAGGNADAGLVARSALGVQPSAGAFTLVDSTLHAPIRQAAAVVARSTHAVAASRFLGYATGPAGYAVLARYGFGAPASTPARTAAVVAR